MSTLTPVSDDHKAPQSYILHAVVIAVLIAIALVAFLIHQWPSAHRFG